MGRTGEVSRRRFLQIGLGGAFFGLLNSTAVLDAAEQLNYEYLRVVLYPKTEKEKAYLEEIALQLKKRALPERVVYVALRYSEKKRKAERLRYFAEVLPILCKRSGVKLAVKFPSEKKA